MQVPYELTLFFFIIAVIAVLVNVLLIVLALQVPKRTYDIRLILFLSAVDIIEPATAIVISSYNLIQTHNLSVLSQACQIHGPIGYITLHLSMMLVSIIAFTRVSTVYNITVSKVVWLLLVVYTIIYCVIAITNGIKSRFQVLPNGLDCAPLASNDPLSTSLSVAFLASLITFLVITLGCYITLITRMFFEDQDTVFPLQNRSTNNVFNAGESLSRSRRIKVATRTSAVCITYFVLIVPACILLIAEANMSPEEASIISTIIDVCINNIAIANPCLVLFTHSMIYNQICQLFSPLSYKRFQNKNSNTV